MMYELFMKELANYQLGEMYHEAEKKKGFDIEYHEKTALECNYKWNAIRIMAQKILGAEIAMKCSIEARKLAESELEKGNICIE